MRVTCPTCRRGMDWSPDNAFRPFCSERCKLIDLGAWFTEGRAIPGDVPEADEGEALHDTGQRDGDA